MSDLISREAAVEVLEVGVELSRRALDNTDVVGAAREKYAWGLGLIESFIDDIKDLPTADRPQGEWIEIDDVSISCICSTCGWKSHLYEDDVYGMPYCPNCGAKMKETGDD